MTRRPVRLLFLAALWSGTLSAGMLVEVDKDPRYFQRQQAVIFPNAEVKLITFEFEAVGGDQRGKQRAKDLHDQFLAKIHDLHGGAIITYITPPGQKIGNYRVASAEVAKQQKAQMVLWGRVFTDLSGAALINGRLTLVEPPPGISADYTIAGPPGPGGAPLRMQSVIDAPVTQRRVDFNTLENDVTPIAHFLSGLARYYKAASREGAQASRWLNSSIIDFKAYVRSVPEKADAAALAQAQLYLARAYVRLAVAQPARAAEWLDAARGHAEQAARLNPYEASAPTVQAVIAARLHASPDTIRSFLQRAVTLAPTDSNLRVNLAVFDGARGKTQDAIRQLDNAAQISKTQGQESSPAVQTLRRQMEQPSR